MKLRLRLVVAQQRWQEHPFLSSLVMAEVNILAGALFLGKKSSEVNILRPKLNQRRGGLF